MQNAVIRSPEPRIGRAPCNFAMLDLSSRCAALVVKSLGRFTRNDPSAKIGGYRRRVRLTFKLLAGSLIGIALLLGVNVVARAEQNASTFRAEMMRDHLVLSRALRMDALEEWQAGGQQAAFQLVRRLQDDNDGVDVSAWTAAQLPKEVALALQEGREVQVIEDLDGHDVLVTWSPLLADDGLVGSLRLDEQLAPRVYAVSSLERFGAIGVISLLFATVVAWMMGFFANGDPVQVLIDKARRVASGDLAGDIAVTRSDEFGVLAVELNAMSHSLATARQAVLQEAEDRLRAVNNLRHAERLSTVGTLAAGIAHELGTPLNVVLGRTQMIGEAKNVDDAARQAKVIDEQTRRVIRIVRQLLDFARAEQPNRTDVDLHALARSTCELLSTIADDRGVRLRFDDDGGRVVAHIDAAQVQQALTNLVVNAIQATALRSEIVVRVRSKVPPQAGGTLIVAAPTDADTLAESYAAFDVEDEGPGISNELKDKVFTPFFTTKPAGEGTGLGLAVAWGIVKENGGAIEIHARSARSTLAPSSTSSLDVLSGALAAAPPNSAPLSGAVFRMLLPEVT